MAILCGIDPSWRNYPDDMRVWVAPDGRVFKKINDKHPERRQWMEYTQVTDRHGYKTLRICGHKWLIHRLVHLLFVGPLDPHMVVSHRDGNALNNHMDNLLQVTQKVNISHKIAHGTHQSKDRHPRAIHTNAQIAAAQAAISEASRTQTGRLRHGEIARISQLTGVGVHTVRDLSSGKNAWQ